jgi:WD40 repeat protein
MIPARHRRRWQAQAYFPLLFVKRKDFRGASMAARIGWLALLAAFSGAGIAAEPAKDLNGSPLPEGAFARLGTDRVRGNTQTSEPHLLPDGKRFIALTAGTDPENLLTAAYTVYEIATGLPVKDLPVTSWAVPPQIQAISADGKVAASAFGTKTIVFELETGTILHTITSPIAQSLSGTTGQIALSADGGIVAVGSYAARTVPQKDVIASVWDVKEKKEISSMKVVQKSFCNVALSADGKTLATYQPTPVGLAVRTIDPNEDPSRQIEIWDVATGNRQAIMKNTGTLGVALSPDGTVLANTSGRGDLTLSEAKTGKPLFEAAGKAISGLSRLVKFSADGKEVAVATENAVQIWNVAKGELLAAAESPIQSTSHRVRSVWFGGGGRAIALNSAGSTCFAWDVPSGKLLSPGGGHWDRIGSVAFAPGDREVLVAGGTGSGKVDRWTREGKQLDPIVLSNPGQEPSSAGRFFPTRFLPGGKAAYQVGTNSLSIYDLPGGARRCLVPAETDATMVNNVLNITQHSSDSLVSGDGTIAGLLIHPFQAGSARPAKPEPYRFFTTDIAKGRRLGDFELPLALEYYAPCLAVDGSKLFCFRKAVGEGKQWEYALCVFELPSGKLLGETKMKAPRNPLNRNEKIVPTPDGRSILVFEPAGKTAFYETKNAQLKDEFEIEPQIVISVLQPATISPDGTRVAVARLPDAWKLNQEILIYNLADAKLLYTLKGHTAIVTCTAFSNDGKTFATGSVDTTVLLWDISKPSK